jgi:hypothetical protein
MPSNLLIYAGGLRKLAVSYGNDITKNKDDGMIYLKQWEEWHRGNYSIQRTMKRNKTIKEELIMEVMHPCRIQKIIEKHGVDSLDVY